MKKVLMVLVMLASASGNATDVEGLFEKFDEYCSGNDDSYMYEHEIEKVNVQKAVRFAKKSDGDGLGNDCRDGRAYPKKLGSVVEAFEMRMKENCSEDFTNEEYEALISLLVDSSNLAVSASLYAGNDNPEACDYDNYFIFRADGLLINFTFNRTD